MLPKRIRIILDCDTVNLDDALSMAQQFIRETSDDPVKLLGHGWGYHAKGNTYFIRHTKNDGCSVTQSRED